MLKRLIPIFCCILVLSACAVKKSNVAQPPETGKYLKSSQRPYTVLGRRYEPLQTHEGFFQTGVASWYGKDFHGKKTSNGEIYNMNAMTAAHKTLPLGVYVKVHNRDNGRDAIVRVNDRGPFVKGRIIDLSYAAAKKLGIDVAGATTRRGGGPGGGGGGGGGTRGGGDLARGAIIFHGGGRSACVTHQRRWWGGGTRGSVPGRSCSHA